jgi:hypothetical protein
VSHCIVFGNSGGDSIPGQVDNLYHDPLFCDADLNNYSLCLNSPCLPANNAWGELIGNHEMGCGKCESVAEPAAWATVKQMFR